MSEQTTLTGEGLQLLYILNSCKVKPYFQTDVPGSQHWLCLRSFLGDFQQHLLAGRLPEDTDLLFLTPGRKSLLLDGQGHERLEVLGFGIIGACLPFSYRFAGDAQVLGQARLRQPELGTQGQYGLSKGVVSIAV
jgi:hypothetical protein